MLVLLNSPLLSSASGEEAQVGTGRRPEDVLPRVRESNRESNGEELSVRGGTREVPFALLPSVG
jgi:hypothetical protein